MRLRSRLLRGVSLALAVLVASCVSTTTPKPVELDGRTRQHPFRVAVIPVAQAEYAVDGEAGDGGLLDLQGAATEDGVDLLTKHLHESLQANVFTDVVLLDPPVSGETTEAHWVHAARQAGADLLLDVNEVRYGAKPESSGLWSSYALYLTGPLELLFADRTYEAKDCVMGVSLYDVNLMEDLPERSNAQRVALPGTQGEEQDGAEDAGFDRFAESVWTMNQGALLREFRVTPDEISLRYGDRLKGGLGVVSILKSIVVPSAFLSTDSEELRRELSDRTALSLATNLSKRIVQGDEVYINAPSPRLAKFHMDGEPTVEWRDGELMLELPINRYFPDRITDGRLVVDGTPFLLEFDEANSGTEVRARSASNGVVTGYGFTEPNANAGDEAGYTRETLKVRFDPVGARPMEASFRTGPAWTGQAAPEWVKIILEDRAREAQKQVRSWTVRPKVIR